MGRDQGHAAPTPSDALPRGGTLAVPHVVTTAGRINNSSRAYSQRMDTALQYNRDNAERMLDDPVISTCLRIRAGTTALLTWTVKPEDPENQLEVDAAAECEKHLRRIPRFVETHRWLLFNGLWCGRSGAQVRYGWTPDEKPLWSPNWTRIVHGDKLAYKWDGRVGIAVQSASALRNHCQTEMVDSFPVYFLNDEERDCMIVHRCFSEDVSYWQTIQSGAIEGRGLRHYLYWIWVLKCEVWKMSLDFLQWFAKGLMVYYFEHGNVEHQNAVEEWVNKQNGNSALMFPVFRDANNNPFTKPVERFDVSSANPQFLQSLIVNYFDDLIKFTILHQSGTTSAIQGGLGSAVAEAHETTYDAIVKLDALMLQDTYTTDLVGPWYRQNKPGIAPGKFEFSVDTPNAQAMVEAAQGIVGMGGSVPMEPILEAAGIPAATKGQTILGGPQPSQPAAVGALPDGVPAVGAGDDGQQPVS